MSALSTHQKTLLRDSFEDLSEDLDAFIKGFYAALFQMAPEARGFFKADMDEQEQKLMHSLGYLVQMIERDADLVRYTAQLANTHAGLGLVPEHFVLFERAFTTAATAACGDGWTDEIRETWKLFLADVSGQMKEVPAQAAGGA